MRAFLLFRLYGPMASWGDTAVGETRPTASHPSRSAVMGLVSAALGIRRDDEARLSELNAQLGFGVRVDAAGELLRDYHTAQVPPARRKVRYYTRRDELRDKEDQYTILSSRDYRTDGCYTIALWMPTSGKDALAEIKQALAAPKLTLYLGRKSCPLAVPLNPQMVTECETLKSAFDQYPAISDGFLGKHLPMKKDAVRYYWEGLSDIDAGMKSAMRQSRQDGVRSRKRWQFSEREEFLHSEQRETTAP